jgi:hypothetical protein
MSKVAKGMQAVGKRLSVILNAILPLEALFIEVMED